MAVISKVILNKTDSSSPHGIFEPSAEAIQYIIDNYEKLGLKPSPVVTSYFEDGTSLPGTHPGWVKREAVTIFFNQDIWDKFYNDPVLTAAGLNQNPAAVEVRRAYYDLHGVTETVEVTNT